MEQKIPKRILVSLMNALAAGVVPRTGAPYIAIGRKEETESLLSDLESVADGGSALRFLVGRYGSGKSFLLQLIRGYALENGFVTCDADLSPERRLSAANGNGVATYRELITNMSCKTSADGGALPVLISKWLSSKQSELAAKGEDPDSVGFAASMQREIYSVTEELEDKVGGFDFATVINKFYQAQRDGNDSLRSACVRWLRGEYLTKTEAKRDLGTQGIINDDNWYDYLKLLAAFVTKLGYKGLMVYIDECVNLYKITNRISRENNYEKLLSIFNDTLQGKAPNLGFVFVGTPQFLEDTRRGLFSYEALRSRLADSMLINGEFKNLAGPVIRLVRLTDSELFALMTRINRLYSECYSYKIPLDSEQMQVFLTLCLGKAGSDVMITPREIIRSYISLLHILRQNSDARFENVISGIEEALKPTVKEDPDGAGDGSGDLSDFEL
ncbi:MAG: ATP-binding protein [Clostridia bacterium]|nr:ATP-binding protein [Clostridia bacterium]